MDDNARDERIVEYRFGKRGGIAIPRIALDEPGLH